MTTYARQHRPVLRRPVESGQFRSIAFVSTLKNDGLTGSMGRVGASGDNAAMESFFALLQRNVLDVLTGQVVHAARRLIGG